MIKTEGIQTREIVPGRAMLIEMQNADRSPQSILAVYTPNAPGENAAFWTTIQKYFKDHPNIGRPEMIGGDSIWWKAHWIDCLQDQKPGTSRGNG
jgi:hypothetical protein